MELRCHHFNLRHDITEMSGLTFTSTSGNNLPLALTVSMMVRRETFQQTHGAFFLAQRPVC
jgi:hypothetical protein